MWILKRLHKLHVVANWDWAQAFTLFFFFLRPKDCFTSTLHQVIFHFFPKRSPPLFFSPSPRPKVHSLRAEKLGTSICFSVLRKSRRDLEFYISERFHAFIIINKLRKRLFFQSHPHRRKVFAWSLFRSYRLLLLLKLHFRFVFSGGVPNHSIFFSLHCVGIQTDAVFIKVLFTLAISQGFSYIFCWLFIHTEVLSVFICSFFSLFFFLFSFAFSHHHWKRKGEKEEEKKGEKRKNQQTTCTYHLHSIEFIHFYEHSSWSFKKIPVSLSPRLSASPSLSLHVSLLCPPNSQTINQNNKGKKNQAVDFFNSIPNSFLKLQFLYSQFRFLRRERRGRGRFDSILISTSQRWWLKRFLSRWQREIEFVLMMMIQIKKSKYSQKWKNCFRQTFSFLFFIDRFSYYHYFQFPFPFPSLFPPLSLAILSST